MVKARAFFYVAAGIFLLALSYHFGARNAGAQLPANQEVAVLSGQVPDGGTIPLPHYADGTEATESECRWTVSPQILENQFNSDFQRCSTDGRTVRVYMCAGNCGPHGDCIPIDPGCVGSPNATAGVANYFIVAVRNSSPTAARQQTWGAMKSRYRGDRGAAQPQRDR